MTALGNSFPGFMVKGTNSRKTQNFNFTYVLNWSLQVLELWSCVDTEDFPTPALLIAPTSPPSRKAYDPAVCEHESILRGSQGMILDCDRFIMTSWPFHSILIESSTDLEIQILEENTDRCLHNPRSEPQVWNFCNKKSQIPEKQHFF